MNDENKKKALGYIIENCDDAGLRNSAIIELIRISELYEFKSWGSSFLKRILSSDGITQEIIAAANARKEQLYADKIQHLLHEVRDDWTWDKAVELKDIITDKETPLNSKLQAEDALFKLIEEHVFLGCGFLYAGRGMWGMSAPANNAAVVKLLADFVGEKETGDSSLERSVEFFSRFIVHCLKREFATHSEDDKISDKKDFHEALLIVDGRKLAREILSDVRDDNGKFYGSDFFKITKNSDLPEDIRYEFGFALLNDYIERRDVRGLGLLIGEGYYGELPPYGIREKATSWLESNDGKAARALLLAKECGLSLQATPKAGDTLSDLPLPKQFGSTAAGNTQGTCARNAIPEPISGKRRP